jgi:hypothetical protein
LTLLSIWAAGSRLHADGTWIELEPLPEARQEIPAVVLDGNVYAAGGMMNFSATAVNRFERYDGCIVTIWCAIPGLNWRRCRNIIGAARPWLRLTACSI